METANEDRTNTKTKVLFVDDEVMILRGLKRALREMKGRWEMSFVESGAEALELLATEEHDVVVSDMRMPSMDGATLLTQVKRLYPQTVRLILSGYADEEMVVRAVNTAHQYLSKPCQPDQLRETIERTTALRATLRTDALRSLVGKIGSLPEPPRVYQQIMTRLAEPECSLEQIGEVIGKDPAIAAKVLQLVNSSFFGIGRTIDDIVTAVSMLGLDLINTIILKVGMVDAYREIGPEFVDEVASHSVRVAASARDLMVQAQADPGMTSGTITAAMLHDVGKLVLASYDRDYPELIQRAEPLGDGTDLVSLETQSYGASHAELGAYLLGLWNLPDPIVEAVAYHHRPSDCPDQTLSVLSLLHLADAFDHASAVDGAGPGKRVDHEYLARVGLETILIGNHEGADAGTEDSGSGAQAQEVA